MLLVSSLCTIVYALYFVFILIYLKYPRNLHHSVTVATFNFQQKRYFRFSDVAFKTKAGRKELQNELSLGSTAL